MMEEHIKLNLEDILHQKNHKKQTINKRPEWDNIKKNNQQKHQTKNQRDRYFKC